MPSHHNVNKLSAERSTNASSDQSSGKEKQKEPAASQYASLEVSTYHKDRIGVKSFCGGNRYSVPNSLLSGLDHLKNNRLNKELAFALEERQSLGILGLIPPAVQTQELQVRRCCENLARLNDNLDQYIFLYNLQENNEKLFYKLLRENVKLLVPIVYTPTVGIACQQFSLIYNRPRGLFITIHDKGHVYDVLNNWPEQDVRVIVVTDGGRILGLGDLAANGMGIPIGKLSLYTVLAGVSPQHCLPITLDVGTDTQSLLDDPYYIGLRQKRCKGPEYEELVDEFMEAVTRRYGHNTLIQFEDFATQNAFKFLKKYQTCYTMFNDDIQGTAAVGLAGLMAAMRVTKTKLSENVIVFHGAGSACLGLALLSVIAMTHNDGTTQEEAAAKMWMIDTDGLLTNDREDVKNDPIKSQFGKDHPPLKTTLELVKEVKPTVLIGASAAKGTFTPEILQEMAKNNERPIIFALSNPTDKAECTAEEAYKNTDGKALFVSGSPFPPYVHNGKTLIPGQGNNAYIFPGVGLGVMCAGLKTITDDTYLLAARTLADSVTETELAHSTLYPGLDEVLNCSIQIATCILESAFDDGNATTYPEPVNKMQFVKDQMYNTDYAEALPPIYRYP